MLGLRFAMPAVAFSAGPTIVPQVPGIQVESGNLNSFDINQGLQLGFTLARNETYSEKPIPIGASGSVGAILVGAGSNSDLYASFRDRTINPPDISKPDPRPDPRPDPKPDPQADFQAPNLPEIQRQTGNLVACNPGQTGAIALTETPDSGTRSPDRAKNIAPPEIQQVACQGVRSGQSTQSGSSNDTPLLKLLDTLPTLGEAVELKNNQIVPKK
jgi:hypothetical protein